MKALASTNGDDPSEFGAHSLRIGGATALFAAGADPTVIRTMGRRSSDCYRLYVRACFEPHVPFVSGVREGWIERSRDDGCGTCW